MMNILYVLLGCEEAQPKTYADLLNSGNCAPNDVQCSIDECTSFFKTPPAASDQAEKQALKTLCIRLDEENSSQNQACGISACFLLPELYPEGTIAILQQSTPQKASERIARQTLIRGLMAHDQFTSFLEQAPNPEKWLPVAVSEALCEESSSAKQLNITCQAPNPQAAQAAWNIADKFPPDSTSHRSALNLAMILDSKSISPLLLSLLLDESMEQGKRAAAAQALHVATFRGYTINPDFEGMIAARCAQADPALELLCR